jgi:hypothetical protein
MVSGDRMKPQRSNIPLAFFGHNSKLEITVPFDSGNVAPRLYERRVEVSDLATRAGKRRNSKNDACILFH